MNEDAIVAFFEEVRIFFLSYRGTADMTLSLQMPARFQS